MKNKEAAIAALVALLAAATGYGVLQARVEAQGAAQQETRKDVNALQKNVGQQAVFNAVMQETLYDVQDTVRELAHKPRRRHDR